MLVETGPAQFGGRRRRRPCGACGQLVELSINPQVTDTLARANTQNWRAPTLFAGRVSGSKAGMFLGSAQVQRLYPERQRLPQGLDWLLQDVQRGGAVAEAAQPRRPLATPSACHPAPTVEVAQRHRPQPDLARGQTRQGVDAGLQGPSVPVGAEPYARRRLHPQREVVSGQRSGIAGR